MQRRRRLVMLACVAVMVAAALGCGEEREPTPHASTMSDDEFWRLVDATRASAGDDQELQARQMRRRLARLAPERIVAYEDAFDRRMDESYRWDLSAVATIVNGGCGDDCFDYFRFWLISRGRIAYERVLADPAAVGEYVRTPDDTQLELFGSPAIDAYKAVTGSDIPPRTTPRPETPVGRPWRDGELPRLYPELARRFRF